MHPHLEAIVLSQTVSNTEAGSFTIGTITLSGTDAYVTAGETGSIPVTITLTGGDSYAYADEPGTIPVTITLSGTDSYGATPESTVTFLRDRHHNVLVAG